MTTYENLYYYLDHAIHKALGEIEDQNFGAAKKELLQAQKIAEKMRCAMTDGNKVHECFRNPYDAIERKIP